MKMYDISELFNFVLSEITQNYDEYADEPNQFIRTSIEEFTDSSDNGEISDLYTTIKDDLEWYLDSAGFKVDY